MTEWSNLQWVLLTMSIIGTAGSLGWNIHQARRLARLEKAEALAHEGAIQLIDEFQQRSDALREWSTFHEIQSDTREAALLAEKWGAIQIKWHQGKILVRLTHVHDP